jgi:hypothetical protein
MVKVALFVRLDLGDHVNPAIRGHQKSGQRDQPRARLKWSPVYRVIKRLRKPKVASRRTAAPVG